MPRAHYERLVSFHFPFRFTSSTMATMTMKNRIRVLRFEKRMTQEELAVRVGVSRQTIMSIENGNTNPSVLLAFKIALALDAGITDVFQTEGKLIPV